MAEEACRCWGTVPVDLHAVVHLEDLAVVGHPLDFPGFQLHWERGRGGVQGMGQAGIRKAACSFRTLGIGLGRAAFRRL